MNKRIIAIALCDPAKPNTLDPAMWEDYLSCDADDDAKAAYVENFGEWDTDRFIESYRGEYNSDADFVGEMLDETGFFEGWPECAVRYFDLDLYVRDMQSNGEFFSINGFYFWNY